MRRKLARGGSRRHSWQRSRTFAASRYHWDGVSERPDGGRFAVNGKQIARQWLERVDPKKARVRNPDVIAVRVAGELDKEALIGMDPTAFFTEPHYDGYAAVLIHLADIDVDLLTSLLTDAWRLAASGRRGRIKT